MSTPDQLVLPTLPADANLVWRIVAKPNVQLGMFLNNGASLYIYQTPADPTAAWSIEESEPLASGRVEFAAEATAEEMRAAIVTKAEEMASVIIARTTQQITAAAVVDELLGAIS